MPGGTESSTSDSAVKSPNVRVTWSTRMAAVAAVVVSVTGHLHRRRHPRAQLILAFDEVDTHREYLVRALVGGLQITRRVLALRIDVLDGRLERAVERVDLHVHPVANVHVTELGLRHVDAEEHLIRFEQ